MDHKGFVAMCFTLFWPSPCGDLLSTFAEGVDVCTELLDGTSLCCEGKNLRVLHNQIISLGLLLRYLYIVRVTCMKQGCVKSSLPSTYAPCCAVMEAWKMESLMLLLATLHLDDKLVCPVLFWDCHDF